MDEYRLNEYNPIFSYGDIAARRTGPGRGRHNKWKRGHFGRRVVRPGNWSVGSDACPQRRAFFAHGNFASEWTSADRGWNQRCQQVGFRGRTVRSCNWDLDHDELTTHA